MVKCNELAAFISFCIGIFTFLGYHKNYLSYSALKDLKSIFKERQQIQHKQDNLVAGCLRICVSSRIFYEQPCGSVSTYPLWICDPQQPYDMCLFFYRLHFMP